MWIKGYVKETEDSAFIANVHIVPDIRRRGGEYAGIMELSNSDEIVLVKRHPSGYYHGQIMNENDL